MFSITSQEGAIGMALLWVWLLWLLIEFWEEVAIRKMLCLARDLTLMDDCTPKLRRLGFTWACMKVDLSRPLRLGVLVKGLVDIFWQRFVYENLERFYFHCGHFDLPEEVCLAGEVMGAHRWGPEMRGWMGDMSRKVCDWSRGWWLSISGSRRWRLRVAQGRWWLD